MLKFEFSAERNRTTLLTVSVAIRRGDVMPAKAFNRLSNVIAFPRASRNPVALRCEESTRAAICSHCGGVLAKGESEDDCSGARTSKPSSRISKSS